MRSLYELPSVLEHISFRLTHHGILCIQELPCLPRAERRFLPWDSDSLRGMFTLATLGLDRPFRFRSCTMWQTGIPVIHAFVTKLLDDYGFIRYWDFHESVWRKAIPTLEKKVRLRLAGRTSKRAEVLYDTLALATINDYKRTEALVRQTEHIRESVPLSSLECPRCGIPDVAVEYDWDGPDSSVPKVQTWLVRCRACGYEGHLRHGRYDFGLRVEEAACILRMELSRPHNSIVRSMDLMRRLDQGEITLRFEAGDREAPESGGPPGRCNEDAPDLSET